MIGSFSLGGVSSEDFSLVCKSVKRPLLPATRVKRIEIVGLSGAYDFDDDEYALRNLTMQMAYIGTSYDELRTRARTIAAWLSTPTWTQLIINDEPDKHYLVKITSIVDLKSVWESGTANISFDCQPFAISNNEFGSIEAITGTGRSYTFPNLGTRHINYKSPPGSKSFITIQGSYTDLVIALNGKVLNFVNAVSSKTITIDNIEMEIEEDAVNIFSVITGDTNEFLTILPGTNNVDISGNAINVTVTIDYKRLWL